MTLIFNKELLKTDQMLKTFLQFSICKKMISLEGKKEREKAISGNVGECRLLMRPAEKTN